MDWQFKIGLGSTIVFGLISYAVKDMPPSISWAGICAGILLIAWGMLPGHERMPLGPTLMLIAACTQLIGGGAWYYQVSSYTIQQKREFSWTWDMLNSKQLEDILLILKGPPLRSIKIVNVSPSGIDLANSLTSAFLRNGWKKEVSATSDADKYTRGIVISPDDEFSRRLSSLLASIYGEKAVSVSNSVGGERAIVIGAKPIPDVVPDKIDRESRDLGYRLTILSRDIIDFSIGRDKEKSNIDNITDSTLQFDERVKFSNETEILFDERFGNDLRSYSTDLQKMGIPLPFMVHASLSYSLAPIARWAAYVGKFLSEGRLRDAIHECGEEHFYIKFMK